MPEQYFSKSRSRTPPVSLTDKRAKTTRIEGTCPFFQRYYGKNDGQVSKIYCDCAVVKCPDTAFRRKILYGYCAHPTDWQQCQFYKLMESYFLKQGGERSGYEDRYGDEDD